jgi:hypothetical protein
MALRTLLSRWLVALALLLAGVDAARAVDMSRWVDEQGRTQVSDVVPDRYRASARRGRRASARPGRFAMGGSEVAFPTGGVVGHSRIG